MGFWLLLNCFLPITWKGVLASVNNTLYLHLLSHLLILNTFLSLHHLMGVKKYYYAQCETSELKRKGKTKGLLFCLHWMNYEHVDRNAKIRYLIASSHHTHKTIVIIIKNHNKVCPFFFFINVGQIIYFLFPLSGK